MVPVIYKLILAIFPDGAETSGNCQKKYARPIFNSLSYKASAI